MHKSKIGFLLAAALTAVCVLSVAPEVSVAAYEIDGVSDENYKPEVGSTRWELVEITSTVSDMLHETYEYDPATGLLLRECIGGYATTYEYDSNGNLIQANRFDMDGTRVTYSKFEYNGNNQKTRENIYHEDGSSYGYTIYEYDATGKEICHKYDSYGDSAGVEEREYWDNGRIRTKYVDDGHGYIQYFVYNELGETIESQWFTDGKETSYWKYTFENGRHSGFESVRGGIKEPRTYSFEETQNGYYETETCFDSKGKVIFINKTLYEFDEYGNRTRLTYFDENGNVTDIYTYEYLKKEYDTRGHYIPRFDAYVAPEGCTFQYRLYNPNSGEHFYTGSRKESCDLIFEGWHFEGSGFIHPLVGDSIYRLYDNKGDHLYTKEEEEKALLESEGWTTEGIAFPSATPATGRPMYRLKNPNATTGVHHFTMSEEERDKLIELGWKDEGIGWYSV